MANFSVAAVPMALPRLSLIDVLAPLAPAWMTPRDLPWPGRVLVVDTNHLASTACYLATRPGVVCQLQQAVAGGRAQAYIAAHVPGEMPVAIARVAARFEPDVEADAWQIWRQVLVPLLRVVDLPVREYLDPHVREVVRNLYAKGGDPDDLPTAALARFLAPAVLLSEDGIFAKIGMAVPTSVRDGADGTVRAGRGELATIGGAHASVMAGQVAVGAARAGLRAAHLYPKAALMALAAAGLTGWALEVRRPESTRGALQRLYQFKEVVPGLVERVAEGLTRIRQEHAEANAAAVPVRRRDDQSVAEAAAAILARSGVPLLAADLHREVTEPRPWSTITASYPATAKTLTRCLREHDAFIEDQGTWSLGRPVIV